ncbi:hypothetical protein [Absidia glauca]|uniref:Uncharacterized protein n=1 Tax=Absidia glauca TaxID=4829 RepID=A0A163MXN7_ABSGL|nr:hypothetical protein [Absidia glauca]
MALPLFIALNDLITIQTLDEQYDYPNSFSAFGYKYDMCARVMATDQKGGHFYAIIKDGENTFKADNMIGHLEVTNDKKLYGRAKNTVYVFYKKTNLPVPSMPRFLPALSVSPAPTHFPAILACFTSLSYTATIFSSSSFLSCAINQVKIVLLSFIQDFTSLPGRVPTPSPVPSTSLPAPAPTPSPVLSTSLPGRVPTPSPAPSTSLPAPAPTPSPVPSTSLPGRVPTPSPVPSTSLPASVPAVTLISQTHHIPRIQIRIKTKDLGKRWRKEDGIANEKPKRLRLKGPK